jgi:hypothetical protein
MAVTFQNRVEDYIGSKHDSMELSDWLIALGEWLTASAKEVFELIPIDRLKLVSPEPAAVTTDGLALAGKRIVGVEGSDKYNAREIAVQNYRRVKDPNSLEYATVTDPVFYSKGGKLYILEAGVNTTGEVHYIESPFVEYDLTTISNFPTEYEPLVVLGAAIRGKMRQMIDTRVTLPAALDLSSITIPEKPSAPVFSVTDITTVTVATVANPPTYNNSIASSQFTALATLIDTEEDIELAQAKIGEIQALVQNELNQFNEEQVEYSALLQNAVINAQAAAAEAQAEGSSVLQKEYQEYTSVLQKYSADLQQYTAEIGTKVQTFTNNIQIIMTEHGMMGQELQGLQGLYTQELQLLMGGQQGGG